MVSVAFAHSDAPDFSCANRRCSFCPAEIIRQFATAFRGLKHCAKVIPKLTA